MPFMERITWTGIALHAGVLPGYAASHGCVRMPENFACQLLSGLQLGMRVILVRDDIAPAEVAQPRHVHARPLSPAAIRSSRLKSLAATKSVEAEAATRRFKDAKIAASKKAAEAAAAEKALRAAEAGLANAQAELNAAGHAVETAAPPERTAAGGSRQNSSRRQGGGRAGETRCGQG